MIKELKWLKEIINIEIKIVSSLPKLENVALLERVKGVITALEVTHYKMENLRDNLRQILRDDETAEGEGGEKGAGR